MTWKVEIGGKFGGIEITNDSNVDLFMGCRFEEKRPIFYLSDHKDGYVMREFPNVKNLMEAYEKFYNEKVPADIVKKFREFVRGMKIIYEFEAQNK